MSTYITSDSELTSIANAIRTKGGTTAALMFPTGFSSAIGNISADDLVSGTLTVTANGSYNVTNYASATVNVPASGGSSSPLLQSKSITITPSTTTQSQTVTADSGYDGLDTVTVAVPAVTAGSVGTPFIDQEDEISLSPAGVQNIYTAVVRVTPGYVTQSGYIYSTTCLSVSPADVDSGTLTITANGSHNVVGYSAATVNVPTGSASSWTLITSTAITTATTTTTATSILSWSTGNSSLYTEDKIIWIKIRDRAGKRAGYFAGSDTFIINYYAANNATTTMTSYMLKNMYRYSTSGAWATYSSSSTTGYGIYVYSITSAGVINIYRRYSSTYSLTIDGTYDIEVYTLDYPSTGDNIFNM